MLSPGQTIAKRYQVVRTLGQGGYGAVYLVEDTRLAGRKVALKESFQNSAEAKEQFYLEARLLATLAHESLPRVSDHFAEPDGHQFLVMDYVQGQDLTEWIKRGALPEAQAVKWMLQICDAVAMLHALTPPIIHRDIKPSNIKIRPDGRAVLVDFGIAKVYNPQKQTAQIAKAVSFGFSPPEQYGGSTDARSDVYALGATLYCMMTGTVPPEAYDLLMGQATLAPPRQVNPGISPGLEEIILQAMALNSLARFPTAREMANALQACARGQAMSVGPTVPAEAGLRCPRCGKMNRPAARFCKYDRTPLAAMPALAAPRLAPPLRFEMANALARKKDFQGAVEQYAQAAQGGFAHVALYCNWGFALLQLKRVDEAIPVLQRGLAHYGSDPDLYILLGLAYALNDQHQQAVQVLRRAAALNPQQVETHVLTGRVYLEMKQYAEAIAEFERVVKLDPTNAEAHFLIAVAHFRDQRFADAVKWAQQTIPLAPTAALPYYLLGQAYMEMKKWSDAVKALKEAARLDSDDPDPHLMLAACYAQMKRNADVVKELRYVLEIDPDNQVAQTILSRANH